MTNLMKRSLNEAFGTFMLVFFAVGVACLTGGEVLVTALTFGLILTAMILLIGPVSGCHINPAVSFAMLVSKKINVKEFISYTLAQIFGAILSGLVLFGIFKMGNISVGSGCNAAFGYSGVYGGLNNITAGGYIGALLIEIILTCVFVSTILMVTDEKSTYKKYAPVIIGLSLMLVHLLGIKLTGTSVNPARSIGAALTYGIYYGNWDYMAMVWVFIVGPIIGACISAIIYNKFYKNKKSVSDSENA